MKRRLMSVFCVMCLIGLPAVSVPADDKPAPLGVKASPSRQIPPQLPALTAKTPALAVRTVWEATTVPFQKKSNPSTRLAQQPGVREEIMPNNERLPSAPLSTLRASFAGPMGTHMLHADEGGLALYTIDCEKFMSILEPFERKVDGFDVYRTRGNPTFLWAFGKCPDSCGRYAVFYNRTGQNGGWRFLHDATRETPTRVGME